jgi:tRNA-splicing ligase RtcB (3'-phosphate/5'-hydroxy nucleic acid ligase)
MYVDCEPGSKPIKCWASIIEPEAWKQLANLATMPFIHSHVAVMPDAHAGKGSTVGTVIATRGAILPAAVGVDIGCGMTALELPFNINVLDGKLAALRSAIEAEIPVGHASNEKPHAAATAWWKSPPSGQVEIDEDRALRQLGTLGGGNHFIEVCHDAEGTAWILLHSGSRHVGKTIADWHIHSAKDVMKRYFIDLPDPDLAYLVHGTHEFRDYMGDLDWAQHYAEKNRQIMLERVARVVCDVPGVCWSERTTKMINCHHNYATMENHFGANVYVTRKGAVSAREGQWGIIPGSMGTKSYIVQGKGNRDSFTSCSHGAGRRMSRTKAREVFNVSNLEDQTLGVECRKDKGVLDEIPGAYKDIDVVMADQADLVEVRHVLKQVLVVKG